VKIAELKASVAREVDAHREQLNELSLRIHANPELGFQETKAAAWLTEYLAGHGFSIEAGICGLPTAFRAGYGVGKPIVAILAEYDALPQLGHACGHNLIAASAVGAGLACKPVIDQLGGSILIIGTPAEEVYGGKVVMAERGAFDGIDIAMMAHPGSHDTAATWALACQTVEIEFLGRAAHAAAHPEAGINALEAMVQSFNALNSLRQHIRDTFIVRAPDDDYLDELKQRVIDCFTGAATATGARLEYRWGDIRYATLRLNLTLAQLFKQNMESLGRKVELTDPESAFGSTDMGNVSQLVPGIHPEVAIAPREVVIHSPEFALAAASDAGSRGLLDAAKALAMTVADLVSHPETVSKIKEEFRQGG
jgi:metal-dependent amidase/aminoacylase/carboxypeptidase family protein